MKTRTGATALSVLACAALLVACSSAGVDGPLGTAEAALSGPAAEGQQLFDHALAGTNGRSCATCHVADEHYALSPAYVTSLYQSDPTNPLFNVVDADDPTAATPTYTHLQAGLVRVTLTLPDNLDVIDANGDVITNADRTISLWRGVPTVENTAYTAPYQYDDRAKDLVVQADDALHAHSQINHAPSAQDLEDIAAFEGTVFSSDDAAEIADAIENGEPPPDVQPSFPPGSEGAAGKVLFNSICTQCHGTPTLTKLGQAVHDEAFPVVHPDGTVSTDGTLPNGLAIATQYNQGLQHHHDINVGISAITMFGQIGVLPNLQGVDFPHYRIRFYADGSRTQQVVDLPPPPPAVGPSLVPEPFSVDPGRALITGDYNDWEDFAVPQLRGLANTAPYFHDCSAPDLPTVIDFYSRLILPSFSVLHRPAVYPPEGPGLPPESMTVTEKAELLAFLQKL